MWYLFCLKTGWDSHPDPQHCAHCTWWSWTPWGYIHVRSASPGPLSLRCTGWGPSLLSPSVRSSWTELQPWNRTSLYLQLMHQIWNIVIVLVSNLTCHHKQQWNSSQFLRSFCIILGIPVHVYIFMCVYTHVTNMWHQQISGLTFSSLVRSCWKRICSTWRVCSSFLSWLFLVICSLKWVKA